MSIAALLLAFVALGVAAHGLERLNTWYLASDQFAFLTFAGDLREGRVFHRDTIYEAIGPRSRLTMDALHQTYFWRDGQLFSRYPPGFPALLALAGMIGGKTAEHALNPILFLIAMLLLGALTYVLVRPHDRMLAICAASASIWLLLLLPTEVHLWGITVARDLPAHMLGLAALIAALSGRYGWCGLALGFACSIRPDAILYALSVAAIAALERPRVGELAVATVAFLVGAAPLFLYNTVTNGHPLAFTQGGEFRELLGSVAPNTVAAAQAVALPSGGAFKLSHVARSLPGNLSHLGRSLGVFVLPLALGLVWAARRRPVILAALVPYALIAIVFYSFWGHPDPRYLTGVALCAMPVIGLGMAAAARALARREGRAHSIARLVTVLLAAMLGLRAAGFLAWLPSLDVAATAMVLSLVVASGLAFLPTSIAIASPLLAPLALACAGLTVFANSTGRRDPFQRGQVESARVTIEAAMPAGSFLITRTSLGRPAENVSHYTHVDALYTGDIELLRVRLQVAAMGMLDRDRRVFVLLDARDRGTPAEIENLWVKLRPVETRSGGALLEWFVDPARAPAGATLYEAEHTDVWRDTQRFFPKRQQSEGASR